MRMQSQNKMRKQAENGKERNASAEGVKQRGKTSAVQVLKWLWYRGLFSYLGVFGVCVFYQLQWQSSSPATRGNRLSSRSHRVVAKPGELEHGSKRKTENNIYQIMFVLHNRIIFYTHWVFNYTYILSFIFPFQCFPHRFLYFVLIYIFSHFFTH